MMYKICNTCKADKEVSEFYVWGGKPSPICKPCNRARATKWQQANRDRYIERQASYWTSNSMARKAYSGGYYSRNRAEIQARVSRWKVGNKHLVSASNARRRAAKARAIPAWAGSEWDSFVVTEMYDLMQVRTAVTGVVWHVDHKVPLSSELVCGLHCAANLEVVPAYVNLAKSNLTWEHQ